MARKNSEELEGIQLWNDDGIMVFEMKTKKKVLEVKIKDTP